MDEDMPCGHGHWTYFSEGQGSALLLTVNSTPGDVIPSRLPPSLQTQELPGPWRPLTLDLQSQIFLLQQPPERPGQLRGSGAGQPRAVVVSWGKEGSQIVLASLTENRGSPFMWPFSKHLVHTESQGMHTVLKGKRHLYSRSGRLQWEGKGTVGSGFLDRTKRCEGGGWG